VAVITSADLANDELRIGVDEKGTFYYDLSQSLYESWLRQYEIYDNDSVPADADVDPMVKLALTYWLYMTYLSDNITPSALQSFDTSPTLTENPQLEQYNQYKERYAQQLEYVNPDSLLKRDRRSGGRTGIRGRA
jgi:hypothetical protein